MNRTVLFGAFVGSLLTMGALLAVKFANLDSKGLQKELEEYIKKKAEVAGTDYMASAYGLTKARIDKLKMFSEKGSNVADAFSRL